MTSIRFRTGRLLRAVSTIAVAAGALLVATRPAAAQTRSSMPPVKHVFVIMLENEGFDTTFSATPRAPYLADTLVHAGAFLRQYYGTAHFSLGNYIALISGIAPTIAIQQDCPLYDEFVETGMAADGQPIGTGCIFPAHVQTIANQLEAKHLTWGGFMEDMGKDSTREAAVCAHGVPGMPDPTERATPLDQYAAKHNPFVYFHAVIDSRSCRQHDVPLTKLPAALRSARRTPNFTFIVPSLCHDGHDRPCKNGEPGSLESADAFLREWVPRITKSAAFRNDGMLIITFDEALSIDATACCDEPAGPNAAHPGVNGPGGGRTGAVVLSPFIRPGTVSDEPYNHYALLRTVEDLFGLPHLGFAGRPGLRTFGADVFTRPGRPE
jgi:hypothetical protein